MTSFTEFIGLQKRFVKICVSLFPPANFVKDDRLVHSIKITKITTSDLLKTVSVSINIDFCRDLNSVSSKYSKMMIISLISLKQTNLYQAIIEKSI